MIEAGMGWPAALNLDRLNPARMSHSPTSFSRAILSLSLNNPRGSKLSRMLPCRHSTDKLYCMLFSKATLSLSLNSPRRAKLSCMLPYMYI